MAAILSALHLSEPRGLDVPLRLMTAVNPTRFTRPAAHARATDIPLSSHDLLANGRSEPHLAVELRKEIVSADRIDLAVAFVWWYGVHLLAEALTAATARGVP